jgi:hypothetical protein
MCAWHDGFQALVPQEVRGQVVPFDVGLLNPGNSQVEAAFGHPCRLLSEVGPIRRHGPGRPGEYASACRGAHVEHQKRTGRSHHFHRSSVDDNWPAWYASYVVAEQAGIDLPA